MIGLGVGLFKFGRWVTLLGTPALPRGWVAYAPLSQAPAGGLYPWVRLVIWLGIILVWTVTAVVLLRGARSVPPSN